MFLIFLKHKAYSNYQHIPYIYMYMEIFNVRYGNFNELKIKLVWSKVTVLYTSFVSFSWSFLYLLILLQIFQRCNVS